jgi:hypothetical protein
MNENLFLLFLALVMLSLGIIIPHLIHVTQNEEKRLKDKENNNNNNNNKINKYMSLRYPNVPRICTDKSLLFYIQGIQVQKAQQEILSVITKTDRIKSGGEYNYNDLGFYSFTYGTGSIIKNRTNSKSKANSPTTLVYYRLLKNGNSHIRTNMYNYYKQHGKDYCCSLNNTFNGHKVIQSIKKECGFVCMQTVLETSYAESFPKSTSRWKMKNHKEIKYPFTFVRNPITRFISGYSEIESIYLKMKHYLPLYSPLGSEERFKEFIHIIIFSNATKHLFKGSHRPLQHIAPMIGTLYRGMIEEDQLVNQYRLENIKNDWKKLAINSGFVGLDNVYSDDQAFPHASSFDLTNVSKAAKSFINKGLSYNIPINEDNHNNIDSNRFLDNKDNDGNLNYHYIRAICRFYLADFQCTGYDLPKQCQDIEFEINPLIDAYLLQLPNNKINKQSSCSKRSPIINNIINIIPDSFVQSITYILCYFSNSSPRCALSYKVYIGLVCLDNDIDDEDDDFDVLK